MTELNENQMNLTSAIGGLAGACTITLLNEGVRRFDPEAPRLDLLGMNAAAKLLKGSGLKKSQQPGPDGLYKASMAGDLLSNSLYFGMARAEDKEGTLLRGALLGLGAGVGAIALAKPLGIDPHLGAAPLKTKALTVAWYLIGGLVAAAVINMMDSRTDDDLIKK
jgi:hypothetical protein